jgi:hypothetical protein
VQVHGTTARVSAGAENRMLAEKTHSGSEKCQKRSIANFHLTQIQIASGKTHIQKNCPQLSRSEVISRPPILNLQLTVRDRDQHRSTTIHQPHT